MNCGFQKKVCSSKAPTSFSRKPLAVMLNRSILKKNEPMNDIISSFVDIVIEQKALQFTANEINFDELLFKNYILKLDADKVAIKDFKSISTHFISKYKEKFSFKLSDDFKTNADFLNSITNDFTSVAYVHNYHILEKELWKHILKESNSEFRCSFIDYLKENRPDETFVFTEAYSDLLPELNLTVDEIFENSIILTEKAKSDATYSLPLSNVLGGIKNKCKSDYENGVKLLNKSLILSDDNENIISAIISGLYENKRIEFYESILKLLIQEETKLNPILFGLSNVLEITTADSDLFLKLIRDYSKKDFFLISTLSLVFSVIKSDNTQHHNFCFKELESAIENKNTAFYILHNLRFLENHKQKKTDIVVKLIYQEYFTIEKYINPISEIFWSLKEIDSFKKVVLSVLENKPFEKFIKPFHSYLNKVDAIESDRFIIELLIDNSANKRYTGIELFDELSFNQPYRFTYNILELPPISQYKLWVALTQDFHEPKKRLTALLPLIDSNSNLVKESFLCKLEEITEDYGGHVTKVLEVNLDKNIPKNAAVIERVKKYIEDFYSKNIDLKRSIFELNPYYTHYKYIKKYNELFSKKMNQTVEKGARENSLLSILGTNTIELSKGGGWRIGPKREISQLGKVGTSFAMPRGYFINPNEFELQKGFEIKQDWSDEEFIDIKTILENE